MHLLKSWRVIGHIEARLRLGFRGCSGGMQEGGHAHRELSILGYGCLAILLSMERLQCNTIGASV